VDLSSANARSASWVVETNGRHAPGQRRGYCGERWRPARCGALTRRRASRQRAGVQNCRGAEPEESTAQGPLGASRWRTLVSLFDIRFGARTANRRSAARQFPATGHMVTREHGKADDGARSGSSGQPGNRRSSRPSEKPAPAGIPGAGRAGFSSAANKDKRARGSALGPAPARKDHRVHSQATGCPGALVQVEAWRELNTACLSRASIGPGTELCGRGRPPRARRKEQRLTPGALKISPGGHDLEDIRGGATYRGPCGLAVVKNALRTWDDRSPAHPEPGYVGWATLASRPERAQGDEDQGSGRGTPRSAELAWQVHIEPPGRSSIASSNRHESRRSWDITDQDPPRDCAAARGGLDRQRDQAGAF